MARTFGRILNSIWDDADDFVLLNASEQRLYLFLISQPDITHAGVLPMTLRRWASKASDLTVDQIVEDLRGLDAARFVVVDFDTEEVLVRSLMRRDEVYKMPRVLGSAVANAMGISSRRIRRAVLAEVDRFPLAELSDDPTKGRDGRFYPSVRSQVIGHIEVLRQAYGPLDANSQTEPLPEGVPEGVRKGGPGGSGVRAGAQTSPSPSPSPIQNPSASASPSAGVSDREAEPQPPVPPKPPKGKRPDIEELEMWEQFWKAYPRKKDKGLAEKAWNKAIRGGVPAKTILDGVLFYRLDCANKDAQYIKYPATWLNARGWQDEADPQPQAPRAIGAPSEAAAQQPLAFHEVMARQEQLLRGEPQPRNDWRPPANNNTQQFDFGDAFGLPA